jgi:hypothetical protein
VTDALPALVYYIFGSPRGIRTIFPFCVLLYPLAVTAAVAQVSPVGLLSAFSYGALAGGAVLFSIMCLSAAQVSPWNRFSTLRGTPPRYHWSMDGGSSLIFGEALASYMIAYVAKALGISATSQSLAAGVANSHRQQNLRASSCGSCRSGLGICFLCKCTVLLLPRTFPRALHKHPFRCTDNIISVYLASRILNFTS